MTETYTPNFANLEELQVLFKSIDQTAGRALDSGPDQQTAILWLISKLSGIAARDIECLVQKELRNA